MASSLVLDMWDYVASPSGQVASISIIPVALFVYFTDFLLHLSTYNWIWAEFHTIAVTHHLIQLVVEHAQPVKVHYRPGREFRVAGTFFSKRFFEIVP